MTANQSAPGSHPASTTRFHLPTPRFTAEQNMLLIGSLLLILYSTQLLLEWRWNWLAEQQQGELYRQFTGYMLLCYLLLQLRLGFNRVTGHTADLASIIRKHRRHGLIGPVIFYIHSIEVGFAYQTLLAFVFLANFIVGYLNPKALRWRNQIYIISWTILHISLALLTLALLIFHIYIVYNYS